MNITPDGALSSSSAQLTQFDLDALGEQFSLRALRARLLASRREISEPANDLEPARPTDCVARLDTRGIFAALPPVTWLCEGIELAAGAPTMLGGYGFSGKTMLAQDLALVVATGGLVWGMFPTERGRVVHLDYEQGSRLTAERYQRLARARGIGLADISNRLALVAFPSVYLDDDGARTEEWLVRETTGAALAIVDSFRAAAPRQDENSSAVRISLDMLGRVSARTGCAFLVIHHAKKPDSGGSLGTSRFSLRGSGAIFDACQAVLVAAPATPERELEGKTVKAQPAQIAIEKARLSGKTYSVTMAFEIADVEIGDDPRGGLRVTVEVPEDQLPLTERVLDALGHAGGPLSKSALKTKLHCSSTALSAALDQLGGRLAKDENHKAGGQTCTGYTLAKPTQ